MSRGHLSSWARMTVPDSANRDPHDFYPTPPGAITPLLGVETFKGPIWEPACGCGIMSRTLKAAGYDVVSTDLIDRGYGHGGIDFLAATEALAHDVVTNPPFKHAQPFVETARRLVPGKVAVLARLPWLETSHRAEMFRTHNLARVWVFANRVPFQRGRLVRPNEGGGRMAPYAWFVFDPAHSGPAALGHITYDDSWRIAAGAVEDLLA